MSGEDIVMIVSFMVLSFIMGMHYEAMSSFRKRVQEWEDKYRNLK